MKKNTVVANEMSGQGNERKQVALSPEEQGKVQAIIGKSLTKGERKRINDIVMFAGKRQQGQPFNDKDLPKRKIKKIKR